MTKKDFILANLIILHLKSVAKGNNLATKKMKSLELHNNKDTGVVHHAVAMRLD